MAGEVCEEEDTGGGGPGVDKSIFISESTTYAICGGDGLDPLPDVATSLAVELDLHQGWHVVHHCNTNDGGWAVSSDWVEEQLGFGGEDASNADGSRVAVFAGHGWKDTLHFGQKTEDLDSLCAVTVSEDVRLGAGAGEEASMAIFASSCLMYMSGPQDYSLIDETFQDSSIAYILGFSDSPQLLPGALECYYDSLPNDDSETSDVWYVTLTGNWGFEDNRPMMIVPRGDSETTDETEYRALHTNMKTQAFLEPGYGGYLVEGAWSLTYEEDPNHDCG